MNILVTGATGNIGRALTDRLIQAGHNVSALSRNPDKANLPDSVKVHEGDLTRAETLRTAFEGVERFFLFPEAAATEVLTTAREAGVQRVVALSSLTVSSEDEDKGGPDGPFYRNIENAVRESEIEWTILRPGAFASNTRMWWSDMIREQGLVYWPYPNAGQAPIHEADIAEVAMRALTEDGHVGSVHPLTGPQTLTQAEQLDIISTVLGREIPMQEVSPDVARVFWSEEAGLSDEFVSWLLRVMQDEVVSPDPVFPTVEQILGKPAKTFEQWVRDNVDGFR